MKDETIIGKEEAIDIMQLKIDAITNEFIPLMQLISNL